jgi:hypothetical protein
MYIVESKTFAFRLMLGLAIVLIVLLLSSTVRGGIVCGDIDGNGQGPDIGDVTYLIEYQFLDGPQPLVWGTCDFDNDGSSDISDLTTLIDYLFIAHRPLQCQGTLHSDHTSGCLLDGMGRQASGSATSSSECLTAPTTASFGESMEAQFIDGLLFVYHKYAFYNCCMKYAVTWQVEGEQITAFEADTSGALCDCLCYFNLSASLWGIKPDSVQRFIVTLVGIEGDTVGVDTLWMGPRGYFYAEAFGNDIYLHHLNATMNCCGKYAVDYTFNGDKITAQEMDTTSNPCHCECPYDFLSILHDVAPGTYEIVLLGPPTMPVTKDTIGLDTMTVDTLAIIGGPCYYQSYEGQAVITDIFPAAPGQYNCKNAVEVRFAFIPADSTAPQRYLYPNVPDMWPKLTVGAGMNPSSQWVTAKNIYKGMRFPCERRERTMGACSPVEFVFPTIDFSDWADYCFVR